MKRNHREELSHLSAWKIHLSEIGDWFYFNFNLTSRGYYKVSGFCSVLLVMILSTDNGFVQENYSDINTKNANSEFYDNPCKFTIRDKNRTIIDSIKNTDKSFLISYKCIDPMYVSFQTYDSNRNMIDSSINNWENTAKEVIVDKDFKNKPGSIYIKVDFSITPITEDKFDYIDNEFIFPEEVMVN